MPWTNDFRSGHVVFDTAIVKGMTRIGIPANSEIQRDVTSGSPYPGSVSLNTSRPVATFTTLDIADALSKLTTIGTCIDGANSLKLFGQKQLCSGVSTGADHNQYTISKGVLVPTVLSINHRGNAELTFEAYAASPDGAAAPIIKSAASMDAGGSIVRYEMAKVTINAVEVTGKRNVTLNWNPNVTQEGADSDKYDSVVSLSGVSPTATFRGVEPDWLTAISDLDGLKVAEANTIIYLRKRDVALATAEHIAIGLNGLVSWNNIFDAGIDAPGEAEIQADTVSPDGTAAPITVTLNTAIT